MIKHLLILVLLVVTGAAGANGSPAVLTADVGASIQRFTVNDLLRRPDVTTIRVEKDVAYHRPMTYRAIPMASLLKGLQGQSNGPLEIAALDGFVSFLPVEMLMNEDWLAPVAMLAIEDPAHPWPPLPGKTHSAGPLYIVWVGTRVATVRSEQWPYQVARLAESRSPAERWPQLAVDATFAKNDPRRLGQEVFAVQCLVCHKLDGGGAADVGPDLNRPMNPTEYFTLPALRALLRNPASVRNWAERKMPAFDAKSLSDKEIEYIIAYLQHKAANRR